VIAGMDEESSKLTFNLKEQEQEEESKHKNKI